MVESIHSHIKKAKETKATSLNLGNYGLTNPDAEIPELFELEHLEELIFSNQYYDYENKVKKYHMIASGGKPNQLQKIPTGVSKLKNLKKLVITGDSNNVNIRKIENLPLNLQTLYITQNQIQKIENLPPNLKIFYASYNQIQVIENLPYNLHIADIFYNKVRKVKFTNSLCQLTSLNLNNNQINDISFIKNLPVLKHLKLKSNKINDASILEILTQLETLDLGGNYQISNYDFLKKLLNLQYLDLGGNRIRDYSFLKNLTQIETLFLKSNQINNTDFLKKATQLKYLDLSHNKISNINFLNDLPQLISLSITYNQIHNINLNLLNSHNSLTRLYLNNNPIKNIPIEIFNKGNCLEGIRNYLEDLEDGKSKNNTLKLIFIGNGNVGKTQIARRIAEEERFVFDKQYKSTHAIVRLERDLDGVQLHLWDFAGQDMYHATHRLFMQTRALFILVWDFKSERDPFHISEGNKYKNEKLLYWLEYAKCFGENSPVLVIQNKVDTIEDAQNVLLRQQQQEYLRNYPILDFIQVSAENGKGFVVLEEILKEHFEENAILKEYLNQDLPDTWIKVRSAIEKLRTEEQRTLELVDFQSLPELREVKKSTSTILEYLHDTSVLYYHPQYFGGKIIIDQSWAIKAIYKVLERNTTIAKVLKHKKGKLDYKQLCKIWKDYSKTEKALFMNFMLSTELCFETTQRKRKQEHIPLEKRTFVVPAFLSNIKPKQVDFEAKQLEKNKKWEKVIKYDFLPMVFIQRFIVSASRLSGLDLMWERGIVLVTKQGTAIVESDGIRYIYIQTNSPKLINVIEEELEEISKEGKIKARIQTDDSKDFMELNEEFMRGLKNLQPKNYPTDLLDTSPHPQKKEKTNEDVIIKLGEIKDEIISTVKHEGRRISYSFDRFQSDLEEKLKELNSTLYQNYQKISADISEIKENLFESNNEEKLFFDKMEKLVENLSIEKQEELVEWQNNPTRHKIKAVLPLVFFRYEAEMDVSNFKLPRSWAEFKAWFLNSTFE